MKIPVIANGDILSYEDGVEKMVHPGNRKQETSVISTELSDSVTTTRYLAQEMAQKSEDFSPITETDGIRNDKVYKNLDGFMIGRASF